MSWIDDELRRQMLFNDSLQKSLLLDTSIASLASKELLNPTAYTPPNDLLNIAATVASADLFKIGDPSIQAVAVQPSYIQDLLSQKTLVGSPVAQPTSIDSIFQLSKAAEITQTNTFWQLDKSLFDIPNTVQLTDLARGALDRQAAYVSVSDTMIAMSGLQSPWLDTRNPLGSVSSFATIQAIGFGTNHTPFEPEFMSTLRGQLGDWRDVDSTPPAIFEDAAERSKFYIARGFRTELVNFTPEALEEIVENVGLGAADDENFEWHERTYAHVIRIERKLRKHVNAVMTKAFGENWISFDGNLVDRCKATKARRLADGEPERPHLVYYAELSDLCSIMERKNHFPLFKPIFKRKEAMQETFKRVVPARHAVMHDGIVTPIDFLTVMIDHMNLHQGLKRQEG
jgi:hypothetical protein